jgi:pantoate--beta-alanine ligase
MKIFKDFSEWRKHRDTLNETLGFVPTMGALHDGHLELVRRSRAENKLTAVSIYVNPTQFNDPKDFEKYPNTFEADQTKLREAGADFLIYPTYEQMYADGFRYFVDESSFSLDLCGKSRPGHFKGVLTVVMKLLNGVRPDHAYFGEKDYQQFKLIEGMAEAFFLKAKIVGCPTVREKDGLAMSSRNLRLTHEQREIAPVLYREISAAKKSGEDLMAVGARLAKAGFKVDYLERKGDRLFVAAFLGDVRLIDNV